MKTVRLSIYEEHIEEIAILYERRSLALLEPGFDLDAFEQIDARIEAHLDGLVLGGALALELCEEHARGDDPAQLFAAVSVYCRQERLDLLAGLLAAEDDGQVARLRAIRDAAARELPPSYASALSDWLGQWPGPKSALLAHVAGVRRLQVGSALIRAAQHADDDLAVPFLRAIGRTSAAGANMLLYKFMQLRNYGAARAASLAGLMMEDSDVSNLLLQQVTQKPWAAVALAVAGRGKQSALESYLSEDLEVARDVVLALGMLGDGASIGVLIEALRKKELAVEAAAALHILTGATLLEERPLEQAVAGESEPGVHAETAVEPEQEHEHEEDEFGPAPLVTCLSVDPKAWAGYLDAHGASLVSLRAVRGGQSYDPCTTLRLLRSAYLPMSARRFLVDELALRHGVHVRDADEVSVSEALASFSRAEAQLGTDGQRGRAASAPEGRRR